MFLCNPSPLLALKVVVFLSVFAINVTHAQSADERASAVTPSARKPLLAIVSLTNSAPTFVNGQLTVSLTKAPPVSGWSYAEQFDLCRQISAGDIRALTTLQEQVEKRSAWAQRTMAGYYKESSIVQPNPMQAVKLYLAAAEQGDMSAQHAIGWIFLEGYGVAKDYLQARYWLKKAEDQGDSDAQVKRGEMLRDGQGGETNISEALVLFRKAAESNNIHAQINLATAYSNGLGVPVDLVQAYKWLFVAAEITGAGKYFLSISSSLEIVNKELQPGQVAEAKEQAAAWLKLHPRVVLHWPPPQIGPNFDPKKTCMRPEYPEAAKARGEQGKVTMKLWISANGAITNSEIVKSSGYPTLDQATISGIGRCSFTPALRFGLPVDGTKEIVYVWQ